jgi:hypothetical protein
MENLKQFQSKIPSLTIQLQIQQIEEEPWYKNEYIVGIFFEKIKSFPEMQIIFEIDQETKEIKYHLNEEYVNALTELFENCRNEYNEMNKFNISNKIKKAVDLIGTIDINKPVDLAAEINSKMTEIINFYNNSDDKIKEFIKSDAEMKFCLGIIAYYLDASGESEDKSTLKSFFIECTAKEMTKAEGMKLIKDSNTENAYWFLDGLKYEQK